MLGDAVYYACLALLLVACQKSVKQSNAVTTVPKDSVQLIPNQGLVMYHGEPFFGISEASYSNDTLEESIAYLKGIRHGVNKKYFDDGLLSYEAHYENGQLHGTSKSWWKNGNIRSEYHFEQGKAHGIQTEWYAQGQKFKEQHLVQGLEEGMQTSWRQNGKVYNNYEARNGRIFGLKRANLCYELKDEEVQYKD